MRSPLALRTLPRALRTLPLRSAFACRDRGSGCAATALPDPLPDPPSPTCLPLAGEVPNILRIMIGDTYAPDAPQGQGGDGAAAMAELRASTLCDEVLTLQCNLDDMPAQWAQHVSDRLFDAGARLPAAP